MERKIKANSIIKLLMMITIISYLLLLAKGLKNDSWSVGSVNSDLVVNFSMVFISIILEAIPFVMIGAFVSAIIHIFVSEEQISRIIPKNKFISLICAGLMGIVFPVCECAIVPITRRLIKKGVPIYAAITFMLAVPIVNPIVLLSTYYAFSGDIRITLLRGIVGFISAIIIGFLMSIITRKDESIKEGSENFKASCSCCSHDTISIEIHNHKEVGGCSCGCGHKHSHHNRNTILNNVVNIITHTSRELREVGVFLIMGAFLSAIMQVYISREAILGIGQGPIASILTMLVLAFVLSLCSEADAFIARTFLSQFTTGSIIGFLVLGPMIDIKNALMLNGIFKFKFVIKLIGTIFTICFVFAFLINMANF